MEIMVLLFETGLKINDLIKISNERFEKFLQVKGLLQKFYFSDPNSNKVGGIYVFDSKESLEAFRESELSKNTSAAYKFLKGSVVRFFFRESELSKSTSVAYKFLKGSNVRFFNVSRTLRDL